MKKLTIDDIKRANARWFSPSNRRFFGDVDYKLFAGKSCHYILQITGMWSDMFGKQKKLFYRLIPIDNKTLLLDFRNDILTFNTEEEATKHAMEH